MEKQQKINILHIVNDLGVGGIEKLVHDLVSRVPSDHYCLEICCVREKKGEWLEPIEKKGIPVHFLGNYRKKPLQFFRAYQKLLAENGYRAVHVHLNHLSGLFLYHPARYSVPVRIAHYHNDFSTHNRSIARRNILRFLRGLSDRYATVSIGISDKCLSSVYGEEWRDNSNVKRIYNGVDLEKFFFDRDGRNDLRSRLGIQEDAIVIGHVGRFRPQKNHAFIVELAAQLCPVHEELVFFLVGDGRLLDRTKEIVHANGLEKHFVFTGARTDVPALMSVMDIFILPSLWEGFGLTVIEAQASGLPVIASGYVPMEIPLVGHSVRIPLNDRDRWAGQCEKFLTMYTGREIDRKVYSTELDKFSIQNWLGEIVDTYKG